MDSFKLWYQSKIYALYAIRFTLFSKVNIFWKFFEMCYFLINLRENNIDMIKMIILRMFFSLFT